MAFEYNSVLAAYSALLDSWKTSVELGCTMARATLAPVQGLSGENDWTDAPSGVHLTGDEDGASFPGRPARVFGKLVSTESETFGPVPGFDGSSAEAPVARV